MGTLDHQAVGPRERQSEVAQLGLLAAVQEVIMEWQEERVRATAALPLACQEVVRLEISEAKLGVEII
jgi:hypothetical protein